MPSTRTLALLAAITLGACKGYSLKPFTEPAKLGGKVVSAQQLNAGQVGYTLYCRTCHGDKGDGKGPSAPGLRPPPRDFTLGTFKFAAVPGGTLPHDDDLVRIVKSGLHGTAMLPWDVPEKTLTDIVQYLKTFSPKWKEEEPGEAIVPTPDPWQGKAAEAIVRGKKLYHGLAQCSGCHPAYASKAEIYAATKELTGNASADFRDDMYGSILKESDYGVKILPPDFLRSDLRSIRDGHRTEDLYRVIASGVGGTAMPTWRGSLPEDDIWALTHYVSSLVELKGTPKAAELQANNQAADRTWTPPPPAKTN